MGQDCHGCHRVKPYQSPIREVTETAHWSIPSRVKSILPSLLFILTFAASDITALDYERDIMPIFEKKCGECHSRAKETSKGGLILDDPDHLFARFEKNSLVVPGDWDASYLFITLYRPEDDDDAMPPKGKGERLTAGEVTLVQKWITEGAPIKGERGAKGEMPEGADTAMEKPVKTPPAPREWVNREGKAITATLMGIEGDVAVLRLANGKIYRYPVENLSDESRAALQP
jgi:hypothetical protein